MVAQGAEPSRAPTSIEDFLWNLHSVLVAVPGPLALEQLREAYHKHLGHKCAIERFLVVGEGGWQATLKRIPHIVTLFSQDGGATCVRATQAADCTKQQLVDVDLQYRRELAKKSAQAKMMGGSSTKAKAKAGPGATPAAEAKPASTPPPQEAASEEGAQHATKRPAASSVASPAVAGATAADGAAAAPVAASATAGGGPEAKRARTDGGGGDSDTLSKMLVQGVVRVLQNRVKAGKGSLPIGELEEEFKALWKVPFNLQQAGESDAAAFLLKWPNKVELTNDGSGFVVSLAKKTQASPTGGAPAAKKAGTAQPKPPAPPKAASSTAAGTAANTKPGVAKAPVGSASASATPTPQAAPAKNGAGGAPKRPDAPSRPPASIEDFLWNMHSVISRDVGLPLEKLKDAYLEQLGHKCAIERFLVVGDGGLAATLKRIPHVVTLVQDGAGHTTVKATQPDTLTKEQLIAADQAYRRQLAQKNAAAKASSAKQTTSAPATTAPAVGSASGTAAPAAAAGGTGAAAAKASTTAAAPTKPAPAEAPAPVAAAAVASTAAAAGGASTTAASGGAPASAGAAASAQAAAPPAPAGGGQTRPAAADASAPAAAGAAASARAVAPAAPSGGAQTRPAAADAGEPQPKRLRTEDADTLSKMLVQGIVRVLQNRVREGKGPLPVSKLEDEFKALWKVPFNLQQAGETDAVVFLRKWPHKVEVTGSGTDVVVQLAKKATEKAKAAGTGPSPPPQKAAAKAAVAATPATASVTPVGPAEAAPAVSSAASGALQSAAADTAATSTPGSLGTVDAAAEPPKDIAKAPAAAPADTAAAASKKDGPTLAMAPVASATRAPAGSAAGVAETIAIVEADATAMDLVGTLREVRRETTETLEAMKELVKRQEKLVNLLGQLSGDAAP